MDVRKRKLLRKHLIHSFITVSNSDLVFRIQDAYRFAEDSNTSLTYTNLINQSLWS